MTLEVAGPFAEDAAWDRATAAGKSWARVRGGSYPLLPVAEDVVGIPPSDLFTSPEKYALFYLASPLRDSISLDFFLPVTSDMKRLPAGTEDVDGVDIDVTRSGTERDATNLEPAPERVVVVAKVAKAR